MAKYKTVVSIPFLDDSYSIEKYTMETDTIENQAKLTEYIRKQDAFDAVEARIAELMTHPEFRRKHLDIDLSGVIRNISAIKPADVVHVVRCRDCKHWKSYYGRCYKHDEYGMASDDYCSYGERRGEHDGR